MKHAFLLFTVLLTYISCIGKSDVQDTDSNGQGSTSETEGGYLFIHMTDQQYGKMFYSVSRDGKEWVPLNDGKVILESYLGHPTVTKGHDGKYYMIGMSTGATPHYPILWSSQDLVIWGSDAMDAGIFDVSEFGYKNDTYYFGAPKIYYDQTEQKYIITWHAGLTGKDNDQAEWESKRTFYILTSDFKTFTPAKRLFNFTGSDADMATIDTIIEKDGDTYYAIIKDERWPEKCSTGKTIRIASSKKLTGPYSNPGAPISPAWREAPCMIKSPENGKWRLYTEYYPGKTYELYEAVSITTEGEWNKVQITPPTNGRHGWIMHITEKEYQTITNAYSKK